jgi:iron complex outermembrane recepter protein
VSAHRDFSVDPLNGRNYIYSAFAQNTTELVEDRLWAMYGSKIEWNSVTGVEVQPSARLTLKINDDNSVWVAASRAVQTPGRLQADMNSRFNIETNGGPLGPIGTPLTWSGIKNPKSEVLQCLTIDTAAFINDYENLIGYNTSSSIPVTRQFNNDGSARAHGYESHIKWQASDDLVLGSGLTYTKFDEQGFVPTYMLNGELHWQFIEHWSFHTVQYWTSPYSTGSLDTNVDVNPYLRSDFGLSWEARKDMDISFWVKNAFDAQHPEMGVGQFDAMGEVPRSFLLQLTYKF